MPPYILLEIALDEINAAHNRESFSPQNHIEFMFTNDKPNNRETTLVGVVITVEEAQASLAYDYVNEMVARGIAQEIYKTADRLHPGSNQVTLYRGTFDRESSPTANPLVRRYKVTLKVKI